MKENSLEWFFNQLEFDDSISMDNILDLYEQAQEIFKNDIVNSYNQGYRECEEDLGRYPAKDISKFLRGDSYYRKNFKFKSNICTECFGSSWIEQFVVPCYKCNGKGYHENLP